MCRDRKIGLNVQGHTCSKNKKIQRNTLNKFEANQTKELRNKYIRNRQTVKLVKKGVEPKYFLITGLMSPLKDLWDKGICEKFVILNCILDVPTKPRRQMTCARAPTCRKKGRTRTFCWVSYSGRKEALNMQYLEKCKVISR